VTASGSMVYFSQFLSNSGILDNFFRGIPIVYKSNNASSSRDVMGTMVLSIVNGQTRYAHINAIRNDGVGPELLGMKKIVSEDSVRRDLMKGTPEEWETWLTRQERHVWEPLLVNEYVLDIDNTVKPIYGHQEGADISYNPKKPGRPSHNYHTCFIGQARLILNVDVRRGKDHAGAHGMPGLWSLIDSLRPEMRPKLIWGDVGYGSGKIMSDAEERSLHYLFKIRRTKKMEGLFRTLCGSDGLWADAGHGWQGLEMPLKLDAWKQTRRCVFLRRPGSRKPKEEGKNTAGQQQEFVFVGEGAQRREWDYVVLATNKEAFDLRAVSQCYRDRGDCENVFDEMKNQWGWCGFTTHDRQRCGIVARLIALVYNWWNIFTRLANPQTHLEAITSRPLLLNTVGRLVKTGGRQILRLTSNHALAEKVREVLERIGVFLNALARTAEQLKPEELWIVILHAAFVKWLGKNALVPVSDGAQMLIPLSG